MNPGAASREWGAGICLVCSAANLRAGSLSYKPKEVMLWYPGNDERRQSWIFPGAVNSGAKGELKSAERKILASKLLRGKAHWWSAHRLGS